MGGSATYKGFPTKHPSVQNQDGSQSNVILGTFGIDNKQYVIPTMVEGKKLTDDQAVSTAMKFGINNYPSFSDVPKADAWAKKYHGKVSPSGKINY